MDKKITAGGRIDDMFIDDRDERLSALSIEDTLPRYGANSLKRPKRALTEAERNAMDGIGVPSTKRS